ncbi:transcriptional regulator [Acetobacter malorum]|uniref:Transcriptional regulator n=2 Tax=Acetobacter malorum TaxID=178901 RepID=A0A149UZV8_9PROT|nr:transcriptional regulator [Acetobacter malorum]
MTETASLFPAQKTSTPRAGLVDMHVGRRIRLRRTLLGLSQEKLGEALGITFQQVQKYERGTNRVGASRLYDLASALDVPISFFFDDMPASDQLPGPKPKSTLHSGLSQNRKPFETPFQTGTDSVFSDQEASLFSRKETIELIRAYYRIPDAIVRKRVLELVRSMAPATETETDPTS